MSYLSVGDVKNRVKRQFGDESGVQVTDADIFRWVADAVRNVILNSEEVFQVATTMDIITGQQDYPLSEDVLAIKGITCKTADSTAYFELRGYELDQFNSYIDGWDGNFFGEGRPTIYTVFEKKLKLFPIPDADATAGIKLYYTSYLTEITDDAFSIELPNIYFNAVVNYCLQQAYELDEDWIAAEIKMSQIQADLHKARGKVSQQQETYKTITILDDDRW